jgi:hypothetical protein
LTSFVVPATGREPATVALNGLAAGADRDQRKP